MWVTMEFQRNSTEGVLFQGLRLMITKRSYQDNICVWDMISKDWISQHFSDMNRFFTLPHLCFNIHRTLTLLLLIRFQFHAPLIWVSSSVWNNQISHSLSEKSLAIESTSPSLVQLSFTATARGSHSRSFEATVHGGTDGKTKALWFGRRR